MSILGIVWIVAIVEWVVFLLWRFFHRTLPVVERSGYESSSPDVLIVHFPGIAGDPRTQIEFVSWVLKRFGNLAYVYYSGTAGSQARWIDIDGAVEETALYISKWHKRHPRGKVVLVGTSLGARVAYRTAAILKQRANIDTKAVLWDPPRGWRDLMLLQKIATVVAWLVYYAPVLHLLLFVQPLINLVVLKPSDDQIDAKVLKSPDKRKKLAATVVAARKTRLSFFIGQSVSLLRPLPRRNPAGWTSRDIAVIRSEHCDVVKEDAWRSWEDQINGQQVARLVVPGTYHAGSGLNPNAYIQPLTAAFNWVLYGKSSSEFPATTKVKK